MKNSAAIGIDIGGTKISLVLGTSHGKILLKRKIPTQTGSRTQDCVQEIVNTYKSRRDVLCTGLKRAGWVIEKPKATMFVWGEIPEKFRSLGSLEFAKLLLKEAKVAVSPGIGFGEYGNDYVRFALVENEQRIQQAVRGIKKLLR